MNKIHVKNSHNDRPLKPSLLTSIPFTMEGSIAMDTLMFTFSGRVVFTRQDDKCYLQEVAGEFLPLTRNT